LTSTEAVVTAHARREGLITSEEKPNAYRQLPYDLPGDPALAHAIDEQARPPASCIDAVDHPCLTLHYPTLKPRTYLDRPDK
ncbi:catechol 1,2-dioxygenase, partial [Burkholderia pseudomallei]